MDPAAQAPPSIDLWRLARKLAAWQTLGLLLAGVLGGTAVRWAGGSSFGRAVRWRLPVPQCPARPGGLPAALIDTFNFPGPLAGAEEGSTFNCRIEGEDLACVVEAGDPSAADQAAAWGLAGLASPTSVLAQRIALVRVGNTCGSVGEVSDPEFAALLQASTQGTVVLQPPTPADTRPRYPRAPWLGALAGALAAALLAGWRARGAPASSPFAPKAHGLPAALALAGLMLTCSMTKVLVLEVGPFKLRFGQLCAVALFALAVRERRRAGAALELPAAPVLAAIACLLVGAVSSLWSYNPLKSAGYLAWAGFDVLVVFGGLALWACTRERLRLALTCWIAGQAASVLMGGVQLAAWAAGRPPPLMEWDTLGLPRLNGFSYEPAYYALYLVPGALLLFAMVARLRQRAKVAGLLAVAFVGAIALSTSRSGWLGLAVGVVLLAGLGVARGGRRALGRLGIAAVAGVAACAAVMAVSPTLRSHLVRFARMGVDRNERTSSAPRLEAMREAATVFARHPALGVGFAGYGGYLLARPVDFRRVERGAFGITTANLYLELAAETGLSGLAAALALLAAILRPALRRLRQASADLELTVLREGLALACLVVFAVMFHFNQTLWRLDIWILLALTFAAGLVPDGPANEEAPQPAPAASLGSA